MNEKQDSLVVGPQPLTSSQLDFWLCHLPSLRPLWISVSSSIKWDDDISTSLVWGEIKQGNAYKALSAVAGIFSELDKCWLLCLLFSIENPECWSLLRGNWTNLTLTNTDDCTKDKLVWIHLSARFFFKEPGWQNMCWSHPTCFKVVS